MQDADEEDMLDLLEDDEWEDEAAFQQMLEQMPNGWFMVKIINYTSQMLLDIDEWCHDNCRAQFKRIRWSTGCAYSIGIQFEDHTDAVYYRMRWN